MQGETTYTIAVYAREWPGTKEERPKILAEAFGSAGGLYALEEKIRCRIELRMHFASAAVRDEFMTHLVEPDLKKPEYESLERLVMSGSLRDATALQQTAEMRGSLRECLEMTAEFRKFAANYDFTDTLGDPGLSEIDIRLMAQHDADLAFLYWVNGRIRGTIPGPEPEPEPGQNGR